MSLKDLKLKPLGAVLDEEALTNEKLREQAKRLNAEAKEAKEKETKGKVGKKTDKTKKNG